MVPPQRRGPAQPAAVVVDVAGARTVVVEAVGPGIEVLTVVVDPSGSSVVGTVGEEVVVVVSPVSARGVVVVAAGVRAAGGGTGTNGGGTVAVVAGS